MRDIKFRAWDKENKKMLMGVEDMYDGLGDWYDNNGNEVDPYRGNFPTDCFGSYIGNKKIILMQFTGLKDVNGKEIFEGDIVKWDDSNDSGYVSYMSETTEYVVDEWKEGDRKSKGHSLSSLGEVEIIGNIYNDYRE